MPDATWTEDDQKAALAEGWGIFEVGLANGESAAIYQLQRHDEAELFESDAAAIHFVRLLAKHGAPLAIKALAELAQLNAGRPVKTRTGYKATVEIIIRPGAVDVDSSDDAVEWFSELLSNNPEVLDWGYQMNAQRELVFPYPVNVPDDYPEGDLINDGG